MSMTIFKKNEHEIEIQTVPQKDEFSFEVENHNNMDRRNQHDKDDISKAKQKFIRSMEIENDRDLSRDPLFGIEVLRSVAIKSADLGDTDVIKSCITGLFRVLHYALIHKEIIGFPFTITTEESKRKVNEIILQEKNNDKIKNPYIRTTINKLENPLEKQ